MTIYVVDTNVIFGAYVESDSRHRQAVEILEKIEPPYNVPVLALAEIAHFLHERGGANAELGLLQAILDEEIRPVYFDDQWELAHHFADKYKDRDLGVTDSTVLAVAERLFTTCVVSMDQRDLAGVILSNGEPLNLISFSNQF